MIEPKESRKGKKLFWKNPNNKEEVSSLEKKNLKNWRPLRRN